MTEAYTITDVGGPAPEADDKAVGWLLDDLVSRIGEIRYAVMLSSDGLTTGASTGMGRAEAERFSAIASGFHSLAKGAGRHFEAGGVIQTMVELEGGFLFVVAAGEGSCLAVFSDSSADIGLIAYEMALLVDRVGEHLGVPARADGAP